MILICRPLDGSMNRNSSVNLVTAHSQAVGSMYSSTNVNRAMDISSIISSLQLGQSLIQQQSMSSEKRQRLHDSLVGHQTSHTPELGDRMEFHIQNCAYQDEENLCYISVRVNDPNRDLSFSRLEIDFRYHYLNMFLRGAGSAYELNNILVHKLNFRELGPYDFVIDLGVSSTDPPTINLAFERVEMTMSQLRTEFHQFLRSRWEQYGDEIEVVKSFEEFEANYEAKSKIDEQELIPQVSEYDFTLPRRDEDMSLVDRINISHRVQEYMKWVAISEVAGTEYREFQ